MAMKLTSKSTILSLVSDLAGVEGKLKLLIGEDICFGLDNWIDVGDVTLFPSREAVQSDGTYFEANYDRTHALQFGGYEWQLPTTEEIDHSIDANLQQVSADEKKVVVKTFLQGLQDAVRRSLLLYPIFDVHSLSLMPFNRPTTVVPDTSSVHQGALSFVCQFLTPAARIKVPAIVHMEVLMQSDNYFSGIRWNPESRGKKNYRAAALKSHVLSQGGQRTLLRLEIESNAELERGDLGADPLRGIVIPSSDPEDKALGLSKISRSFADRLIFETARLSRSQVRPDHPFTLLTSDQGMARMALSEGVDTLYFQARSAPKISGRRLTGTLFHPFKRELFTVPFMNVLWDLAGSFGAICLKNPTTGATVELWAMGGSEELAWQTDHVRDDLLWMKHTPVLEPHTVAPRSFSSSEGVSGSLPDEDADTPANNGIVENNPKHEAVSYTEEVLPQENSAPPITVSWYKFTPNNMVRLVEALFKDTVLTKEQVKSVLGLQTDSDTRRYIKFLQSGNFVTVVGDKVSARPDIAFFWETLTKGDAADLLNVLLSTPSFRLLYDYLLEHRRVPIDDANLPVSNFAKSTYVDIGEASLAWLSVPGYGIAITDIRPTEAEFVKMALEAYRTLSAEEQTEHILTGQWLETMAVKHSIHPMTAKDMLSRAQDAGLLNIYAEGSTPDTRFDKHTLFALRLKNGFPDFHRIYLYHGDFVLPGTSAVRLKVEGVSNAS